MVRIVDLEDGFESSSDPSITGVGWVVKTVQTVSEAEEFDFDIDNTFQFQPVVSDGGEVNCSTTPFGTSDTWLDGVTIRLVGTSNTDFVNVNFSDIPYGVILNGQVQLKEHVVLELQWNSIKQRWIEAPNRG